MSPTVKSNKDLKHSRDPKKMDNTIKVGDQAWNPVTGVVKKANSESYRIPKKINRTPAIPPVKKVASFEEHLIALEANRRLMATQTRRIRRGSTDCSPRSDTSSCSSNISPVGQTQSTFAIRKQVEMAAATTFDRQLAAFDIQTKMSRSSSSSGTRQSSSSGQHSSSISRHHSTGPALRKPSSSGHHSSMTRHHSLPRSSESSSGSKSKKPETEAIRDKDGDKTSHKRHEDDKTSRKRYRSSSKSSGSKRERLSDVKVESIVKSGLSESAKTEKSDKNVSHEPTKSEKSEKKCDKSESRKSEKLTSEKNEHSQRETVESKSSTSISLGSNQKKSQSEKRSRSPSVSKNSSSVQKAERYDSKKTGELERRRSRKSSKSSDAISCQSQATTEDAQPPIGPIENCEESLKPDPETSQRSKEILKSEENKVVFKFKISPQQKQALKDQASVPEVAAKEPVPEVSADVREQLDTIKAFRQQFPKPNVASSQAPKPDVASSQTPKPEASFLVPEPVEAVAFFVPPPMLSDLEDSDIEDDHKHLPKEYFIYTPPALLSDLEDSDSETDQQLKKKSKIDCSTTSKNSDKIIASVVKTDALSNLKNVFNKGQKIDCDAIPVAQIETKSPSTVARQVEIKAKLDTFKDEKSSKIAAEEDNNKLSPEASKENKLDGQREKKRCRRSSKREDSRRHKEENKKSKTEGEKLSAKSNGSLNVELKDAAVKPKTECVIHNNLFSDSDDEPDTQKYDVYSLARLFQGQVTENFRALNSHILDQVVDNEETDNELYCLCRSRNDITRPMVQCEKCEEWFHFMCVGYFPQYEEIEESFICPPCSSKS